MAGRPGARYLTPGGVPAWVSGFRQFCLVFFSFCFFGGLILRFRLLSWRAAKSRSSTPSNLETGSLPHEQPREQGAFAAQQPTYNAAEGAQPKVLPAHVSSAEDGVELVNV